MKKFKFEYQGQGFKFTSAYAKTVAGAVRVARKKGWQKLDPTWSHIDKYPSQAWIYERCSDDSWERVAVVTERGIETDDNQARWSHQNAMLKIEAAKQVIESNYATMAEFNSIADKEYLIPGMS